MERIKTLVNEILSEATKKDIKKIYSDTERDNFMNAGEALEYGLIDKVIE